MTEPDPLLTREDVSKLVSSMTQEGNLPLSELQAERFLNALTRLQSNVPTASPENHDDHKK